jgi:hypothetical protein
VGYAAGQTDEFKGTGVWNGVKFQREKLEDKVSMDTDRKLMADESSKPVSEESKATTPQK